MNRIEHIKELQEKQYKTTKKQSIIINNFFSLISIIVICITIILYINYVLPFQNKKEQQKIKQIEYQKYLDQRKKEIALSHKLNKQRDTNANK